MKYRVINQSVEVAGKVRHPGDELDASVFAPAPPMREHDDPARPHLTELDSLLATGHVERVPE